MAAHLDFDYLHRLALSDADHRVLDRIEGDRARLLRHERLPEPGEYMELRLRPPGAARHPAGAVGARGGAGSGEPSISLILRTDLAPASLDTFIEIFRDGAHSAVGGFGGEGAHTVVDLGANEGYYTLFMKRLYPGLRVVAVEPLAENVDLFRPTMKANELRNVSCVEAAVTSVGRITGSGSAGAGSPVDTGTGRTQGTIRLETYPHVGTVASTDIAAFPRPWIDPARVRPRHVEAITLPALLDQVGVGEVDILKVDVEGSEVDVLSGAADALRRFRRIVVECHGTEKREQVLAVLEHSGFVPVHTEGKRSGDVYAERR
ncbi:MAG: FkbM family methyltransferase [Spirochaetes bacterium]|jgi:FkbM family methyltransferase|nr:FkbM family methyltransferase [Spirochaetota bacterium]